MVGAVEMKYYTIIIKFNYIPAGLAASPAAATLYLYIHDKIKTCIIAIAML